MAATLRSTADAADMRVPIGALEALLGDLAAVVMTTPAERYSARPSSGVSGSIGKHVRHTLDHVAALLEAARTTPLDYDRRQRGTSVEADPAEALTSILRLQGGLAQMAGRRQDESIRVRTQLTPQGAAITNWSTLGRELAFVVSHTIHHQALIALLLATCEDVSLPERFGYAPSTPVAQ